MDDTPIMSPAGRTVAVFVAEPEPKLRCEHCGSETTDDDPDCPACTTPIDWGASRAALQAWNRSGAG
jgi:hypothetical protein